MQLLDTLDFGTHPVTRTFLSLMLTVIEKKTKLMRFSFVSAAATLALVALTTCALKVDPIAWTAPLNDNNETTPSPQWIASSSTGAVIVVDGANIASLNPFNGAVLWSVSYGELDASTAVFAASSATVLIGSGAKVVAFNLTDGSRIGSAHVTGGPFSHIAAITVFNEYFIVSGTLALAIFGNDLTEHFSIPKEKTTTVSSVGISAGYLYFTADDAEASGVDAYLSIVRLGTFAETRINNIMMVSSTDMNGNILVLQNNNPVLCLVSLATGACLVSLATGAYVWKNTKIAAEFVNIQAFTLVPSTDAALVIGDNKVFAFDSQVGVEIFRYRSGFASISNPTIAEGRLVFVGVTAGVPTAVVSLDLSTGKVLGYLATPTLSTPAIAVSGVNIVMVNAQGYTRIDLLTMTAVSYNLNLPGASAVAALRLASKPTSTTFVIAGLLQASAIILPDA
ncbi:GPI-anchored surface protein, putative [Bodo saltans]|uniref:GPI-anchored surface protein, putative n=1 Tax=Bodo saltans TaxID=75058 RepID=A0A0S4IYK5_BODSA|nr:GPI-anchored surface protein, putative [Bodo saltans]|eukprot:CUG52174.1 GPI-anchored surface protein, putative [Bodo saltans]